MTGVRFADVEDRPAEFLNLTSLTLEEFEVLVAPFEAAFQGRRGASMGNREPLHRLSDLPAVNAGRSAVLPAHLPEDLHRSSGPGAVVRHEPEQSQPVVLLPAFSRRCAASAMPPPASSRLSRTGWLSRRGRSRRWRSLRPPQPPHPELGGAPPLYGAFDVKRFPIQPLHFAYPYVRSKGPSLRSLIAPPQSRDFFFFSAIH